MPEPIMVPFSKPELHVLLRLIANGNDSDRTDRLERQTGTWIADRILRLIGDAA